MWNPNVHGVQIMGLRAWISSWLMETGCVHVSVLCKHLDRMKDQVTLLSILLDGFCFKHCFKPKRIVIRQRKIQTSIMFKIERKSLNCSVESSCLVGTCRSLPYSDSPTIFLVWRITGWTIFIFIRTEQNLEFLFPLLKKINGFFFLL